MFLRSRALLALFAGFASGCAGQRAAEAPAPATTERAPAPAPELPPERTLDRETQLTLPSGALVTVPGGWHTHAAAEIVWLADPERDLNIALLALGAADADAAIAEGWRRLGQHFAPIVESSEDDPEPRPWDASSVRYFEPVEGSTRLLAAVARRKGPLWYLALIDGESRAFARREAQVDAILGELRVAGASEPSWAELPFLLDEARLRALDAFVEKARRAAQVPGLALALVSHDRVVWSKGHGRRVLGGKAAITPETLFLIGSITKPLTTLMLSRLVSQRRVAWDTPVKQLWPALALGDERLSRRLRLADTVCACSGMPSRDLEFLFESSGWDPERRIASLATMKPTTSLGETFQYSNLMVALGGYAGAQAFLPGARLGDAYDRAMTDLVFAPLGMSATGFDFDRALAAEHAEGHAQGLDFEYQKTPIEYERAMSVIRPAAGAWSSVVDLARYMRFELALGRLPNGRALLGESELLERRKPRVKVGADNAYGLGLELTRAHGVEIVGHTGSMLGYSGVLLLLPRQDAGLVLLANASATDLLLTAVRERFLEIGFQQPNAAEATFERELGAARQEAEEYRSELGPPEDDFLEPLLGTYRNPNLGQIEVRREGHEVVLDAGEWSSELLEQGGDPPVLVTVTPPFADFEFEPRE
ncbi:MAG TPA: serine hydrolase domain-containing protein, partial [Polyangiaceae bacterium]|nr:serine hydrolase domain-containing protein [Polyangiaceae bacterium]